MSLVPWFSFIRSADITQVDWCMECKHL